MSRHLRLVGNGEYEDDYQRMTVGVERGNGEHVGTRGDERRHVLVWHLEGSLLVESGQRSWLLSSGSGVWLPAGSRFRVEGREGFVFGVCGVRAEACPELWNRTATLSLDRVLYNLLLHLTTGLAQSAQFHAESVVLDLLDAALCRVAIELPMPTDSRCREVANAILRDPASTWDLADWASEVGASDRTIRRLFHEQTTLSFSQWRTRARMQAALVDLAAGRSLAEVARRSGYGSPSAFGRTFRKLIGVSPSAYLTSLTIDLPGVGSSGQQDWPVVSRKWPSGTRARTQTLTDNEPLVAPEGADHMFKDPRALARAVVVTAAVAALATSCGGDSDSDAAVESEAVTTTEAAEVDPTTTEAPVRAAPTEDASIESIFPVTISHKFGDIVIEDQPEVVVVIGYHEQDFLVSLGIKPVLVRQWHSEVVNPWSAEAFGDFEPEVFEGDIPIERIAALAPDLIIGVYSGIDQDEYDILNEIAPTLAQSGDYDNYGMPWSEQFTSIADAVGKRDMADEQLAALQSQIDSARAAHPEFEGVKAAVAGDRDSGELFAYASADGRSQIIAGLGFDMTSFDELAGDRFNVEFSAEDIDLLDLGVVVWYGAGEGISDHPLREALPLHSEGREVWLEGEDVATSAFGFSSILSIGYALEFLVPELALAVDGDPATVVPSAQAAGIAPIAS